MSEYRARLSWKRETPDFTYETYDRTHEIEFPGGIKIKGTSAPEYKGNPALVNPEELLVSAISSCHMLTFLAVCSRSRLTVDHYHDTAVGIMEKGADGKTWITRIELNPKVSFSGPGADADGNIDLDKLKSLHDKAHHNCIIANSIKSEVVTNLV